MPMSFYVFCIYRCIMQQFCDTRFLIVRHTCPFGQNSPNNLCKNLNYASRLSVYQLPEYNCNVIWWNSFSNYTRITYLRHNRLKKKLHSLQVHSYLTIGRNIISRFVLLSGILMLNKDLYRDSLAITSNNISLGILMQTKLPRSQVTVRELCVSFVTRKRCSN